MLRIRLLGGFRVDVGDRVIADNYWRLQKARALVKLLALAPRHRLCREDLMERLWPEVDPEAALNNLYYALHIARGVLDREVPSKTPRTSALQLAGGVVSLAHAADEVTPPLIVLAAQRGLGMRRRSREDWRGHG